MDMHCVFAAVAHLRHDVLAVAVACSDYSLETLSARSYPEDHMVHIHRETPGDMVSATARSSLR